jgi:hypothetical protein
MKKYISILILIVVSIACADDSLLPLPYNNRTSGAYLRIYSQTSTIFDLGGAIGDLSNAALANSAFDVILEPVDVNGGNDLASVDFFVSHRRGTDLTPEVFLKKIDASIFTKVPEPTYSEYRRGAVRVTAIEALTALLTITADPDGVPTDPDGDGIFTNTACPGCVPLKGLAGFGASNTFQAGDQINIRYEMVMKDGRKYSAANPQSSVNPAFANSATANSTPNITTGQFYNSPFVVTMTVRSQLPNSWIGTYSLTQNSLWSPNHTPALHATAYPSNLNSVLFENQTVTLSVPANGLSTEREFTVTYRQKPVKMRLNLENGTVFIPLQNSTVNCSTERQLYWTQPAAGTFTATPFPVLPLGLPQATTSNRGAYSTAITGTTPGESFTIGVDDDCDEYGRRNGYCSWTRRVALTLTKL